MGALEILHGQGQVAEAAGQWRVQGALHLDASRIPDPVEELDAVAVRAAQHRPTELELLQRELELDLHAQRRDVPLRHRGQVRDVDAHVVEAHQATTTVRTLVNSRMPSADSSRP